jgi:hypothetical protein
VRKVPILVMWYIPIIDRLKCMFSNAREAQLWLWHVQRKRDGKIQHHVDGRQWKHFDLSHEEDFSNDPRKIRMERLLAVIKCIYLLPTYLHFIQDIEDRCLLLMSSMSFVDLPFQEHKTMEKHHMDQNPCISSLCPK